MSTVQAREPWETDPGPEEAPVGAFSGAEAPRVGEAGEAAAALAEARVDLIALIRHGIPDRVYVPGAEPLLLAGKRYLLPAPAGTGKSLLMLVVALDVIAAGGTVAILDVENGSEEYARRLEDVLEARPPAAAETCAEGLRYFAWPQLRKSWGPEEWAAALEGADLVVFDSSRFCLTSVGLAEDVNDDYAEFMGALVMPLSRAGITTVILDNTGHEEKGRARGASSKADLNEVVYSIEVGEAFDRDQVGHLRLIRQRTRFAELPGELHLPIGGGIYGPLTGAEPTPQSDAFRPTGLMQKLSEAVAADPGLSRNELLAAVGGKKEYATLALGLLVSENYVERRPEGQAHRHYPLRSYRENEDPGPTGSQVGPDRVPDPVDQPGPRAPLPVGGPVPGTGGADPPTGSRKRAGR